MADQRVEARPTLSGLAGRLRALRQATRPRMNQTVAAQAIGASQNKISRAESGERLLEPGQVRTLARLYGAGAAEVRELVAWAEALAPTVTDSRLILQRGVAGFQQRIRRAEEASEVVRSFHPSVVIGSLQTEAYARIVFGGADEVAVVDRTSRSRMMLSDPARQWVLIMTEGTLLNLGGPAVMLEQLESVIAASHLPNVDLRIASSAVEADFVVTHGFHLYDDQSVHVGTLNASTLTTNRRDVADYRAMFDRIAELALGGDDARAVVARIAARFR